MTEKISDYIRKTSDYIRKTVEVASGIRVICEGNVTELESGRESGSDKLCLVTKRGTELLDSSPYFIDLQSATLEGNEILIKWERQEERYERREVDTYYGPDCYIEKVIRPRKCEKRIPIH